MESRPLGEFSGTRRKTRFQYCLKPLSSNEFLYFRAIQGHSGGNFVDPLLQDKKLLPDDFDEYTYHIGNAYDTHSIIQSGLIPGGRSNSKDRQSEVEYDLDKPKIASYKHTWRSYHNTVNWCIFKNLLKVKDHDSIKLDRMQLLFQTHYQRFVSVKWFA